MYLSIYRSIYGSIDLSIYVSISFFLSLSLFHLITYLSIYLNRSISIYIHLSIYQSIYLNRSIYLCIYVSMYLSIYLSLCLSVYISLSLSVYLSVYIQAWKRSDSASLPQFFNLATSKTQQLSETSSIFELDNVKNVAILRDFLIFRSWQHQKRNNSVRLPSKMESWVQSWRPRTIAFCDFSSPPVWSTAPATKKWCQVIRSAAPVTQNHLSKPVDRMLQNATSLRKSAPGPPNTSDEHVSCTAPATENASLQILFKCPTPAIVFGNATKPSRFAHFWQGPQSLAPATRNDIWTSKSGPSPWCFSHFNFEMCFARQHRALFRHLNFQKWSDPNPWCFSHFNFEMCFVPQRRALFRHLNFQKWSGPLVLSTFWLRMCFAPQRRALFQHLNFQKWSENGVFCTFSLRNVLRATMACTFSTSQFPKVVWSWCVLYILTWKCASRHNRMQFFICHLASGLRTRRFSEPTFRPQCFATFLPFRAPGSSLTFSCLIFSLLLFSSLFFCSTSAFHLSILSEVWLLNFLRSIYWTCTG